jgi:hypothetical protein
MARDFDSVAECYTSDELRQLILSLEVPPAFAAAMMSSKTMSRAVSCESAPFMRTVRCRTVAKALSIGFDKRRCVPCSAEKSENVNNASREQEIEGFVVFGHVFLGEAKIVIAASAAARFSESQISRKSRCALG